MAASFCMAKQYAISVTYSILCVLTFYHQEARDRIFEEFNSLSVVYSAPASTFEDQRAYHSMAPEEQLGSSTDMRPGRLTGSGDVSPSDSLNGMFPAKRQRKVLCLKAESLFGKSHHWSLTCCKVRVVLRGSLLKDVVRVVVSYMHNGGPACQ